MDLGYILPVGRGTSQISCLRLVYMLADLRGVNAYLKQPYTHSVPFLLPFPIFYLKDTNLSVSGFNRLNQECSFWVGVNQRKWLQISFWKKNQVKMKNVSKALWLYICSCLKCYSYIILWSTICLNTQYLRPPSLRLSSSLCTPLAGINLESTLNLGCRIQEYTWV